MTKFLSCFLFLFVTNLFAQVGINTATPDPSSMLDITSINRGLLLPRVALVNTVSFAPLLSHVAGMTVYNTATAGDVTPGNYFNDGTLWIRMADASAKNNIYVNDGTLTGSRTVTQDANTLNFEGPANGNRINFNLSPGTVNLILGTNGTNLNSNFRIAGGTSNLDLLTYKGSYSGVVANGEDLYLGTASFSTKNTRLMTNGISRLTVMNSGRIGIGISTSPCLLSNSATTYFDATGRGVDASSFLWNSTGAAYSGIISNSDPNSSASALLTKIASTNPVAFSILANVPSGDAFGVTGTGQVFVGTSTNPNVITGALEITSTTKGVVLPRMTKTQRNAIVGAVAGTIIYQTDNSMGLRCFNGSNWVKYAEILD